jgi:dolichol-phosphate mannosyltransferase
MTGPDEGVDFRDLDEGVDFRDLADLVPDLVPAPRAADARPAEPTGHARPDVSVLVPTRNEAPNVEPLLRRLDVALRGVTAEVIFVDDSDDETPATIERAGAGVRPDVRVHHRPAGERPGGLGGAVTEGLRLCRADHAVVIDGDLQHPPERIPDLLAAAREQAADFVVGSRYVAGGSAPGLSSLPRRLVSSSCNLLSRLLFPRRLRGVTDVMSGFFLVRVGVVDTVGLRPDGYKILLELLVRTGRPQVAEVGYVFGERHAGASNASVSEGLRFARRLFSLRVPRPARFAMVGVSGVIPNLVGTSILNRAGLHYVAAAVLATQLAILWNFMGCELLVWQRSNASRFWRYFPFAFVNNLDLLLRIPLLALLVERWHVGVELATLATLVAAVTIRYLIVGRLIYRERAPADDDLAMARLDPVPESVP